MQTYLTDYLPDVTDIRRETYQFIYNKVIDYMKSAVPDVDISPGSVVGDIVIRPLVITMAIQEEAVAKFTNDLDLDNIKAGNIYNEDFVRSFLKLLGGESHKDAFSYGTATFIFDLDIDITIPKNLKLSFAGNSEFYPMVPFEGDIKFVNSKSYYEKKDGQNIFKMLKTEQELLYVDIPVYGRALKNIEANSAVSLDYQIPGIASVTNPYVIRSTSSDMTVAELANYVSKTIYAAGYTNRNSIVSYFKSRFPFLNGVYASMPSDNEMIRGARKNIFSVSSGAVDIYTRPNLYPIESSLICTASGFNKRSFGEDGTIWDFTGELVSSTPILQILSVTDLLSGEEINPDNIFVFGRTEDNTRARSATCSFSNLERLSILLKNYRVFEVPTDQAPTIIEDGMFENYIYRPNLESVGRFFTGNVVQNENGVSLFNTGPRKSLSVKFKGREYINNKAYYVAEIKDDITGAVADNALFEKKVNKDGTCNTLKINYIRSNSLVYSILGGAEFEVNILYNNNGTLTYIDIETEEHKIALTEIYKASAIKFNFKTEERELRVTYLCDPDFAYVSTLSEKYDERPMYDVLVRYPNRFVISNLTIKYKKKPWDSVDEEAIRLQARDYINSVFYPDLYSDTVLGSIVVRNGATAFIKSEVTGNVYVSPASYFIIGDREIDGTIKTGPFNCTTMNDFEFKSLDAGYYATERNTVYYVDANNIKLEDVSK